MQLNAMILRQSRWWSWTPHDAMRLSRARMLLGPNAPRIGGPRDCDGHVPETAPLLTGAPAQ